MKVTPPMVRPFCAISLMMPLTSSTGMFAAAQISAIAWLLAITRSWMIASSLGSSTTSSGQRRAAAADGGGDADALRQQGRGGERHQAAGGQRSRRAR